MYKRWCTSLRDNFGGEEEDEGDLLGRRHSSSFRFTLRIFGSAFYGFPFFLNSDGHKKLIASLSATTAGIILSGTMDSLS